jgi:hypothetical protein
MAKSSFVGFQENIEIPTGFQLLEIHEELISGKDRDSLFLILSSPEEISQWFYPLKKFESRPSGKFIFVHGESEEAGICTSFVLGKEISFITSTLGNISGKVGKGKHGNLLSISFKILTDEVESKREEILDIIKRLRAKL